MQSEKDFRMCRHLSVGAQVKMFVRGTLKPPVISPLRDLTLSKIIDKYIIRHISIKIKIYFQYPQNKKITIDKNSKSVYTMYIRT